MWWPCNLTCRWGSSAAWARGGRLSGSDEIPDAMGRTLECIRIPGQQPRVVVSLGRLLGVFIDDLCRHTLKSARPGLGGVALDARLGLSVDESGHGGELGVVGEVDGLDPVLLPQLIRRERWGSDRRDCDPLRARRLRRIHERCGTERNEPLTVFGSSSSFETNCDRTIPTMTGKRKAELIKYYNNTQLALSGNMLFPTHAPYSESSAWLR